MDLGTIGIVGTVILAIIRFIESAIVVAKSEKTSSVMAMIKEFFKIG